MLLYRTLRKVTSTNMRKKHVRRDSKMCCCCCCFCCGGRTKELLVSRVNDRIHVPVLHDASQMTTAGIEVASHYHQLLVNGKCHYKKSGKSALTQAPSYFITDCFPREGKPKGKLFGTTRSSHFRWAWSYICQRCRLTSSCQAVKLSRLSVKAFGVVKTKHPLSPG